MIAPTDRITAGYEVAWAAAQHGDREAIVCEGRSLTFREVNERANRLANALRGRGHDTGERIGVLLHNSIESVDSVFGLLKSGLCMVPLNTRHALPEQIEIANDAGLSGIIAGAEFKETVQALATSIEGLRTTVGVGWNPARPGGTDFDELLADGSPEEPGVELEPRALMRLTYTSGTTGKPKGVVGTHKRHLARLGNFFASCEYALGREHTMAQVGPLSHVAGNYLQPCFMRGARTIILRSFDPEALQQTIVDFEVDHLLLVPTMIVRLVDALQPDRYNLSSLKRINYGTAPIPVEVLRRGIAALGPVFRQHYGMTEAESPLTLLYPDEHVIDGTTEETARLASCGRPVAGHRIRIVDDEDREMPVGQVGEIAIRAQGSAELEYWKRPDLTAEAVRDGWFLTGDLGRFDDAGYLFIVGRNKDMIISGGFNVYAREVEEALFRHPDVLEAGVVGVPDRDLGEVVAAMLVAKPGATLDTAEVDRFCREQIAGYKRPRLLMFAETLPKNANGKIAKQEIREAFARERSTAAGEVTTVGARY